LIDIGHAHLADGSEEERIEKSFAPLRELVSSVHLHDNHAEKDEHLPPYDGTIEWPAAIKLLKSAPQDNLPLVLELKEKTGPEAPSAVEQLAAARKSMDSEFKVKCSKFVERVRRTRRPIRIVRNGEPSPKLCLFRRYKTQR
jgi:sugar phosphate isomerase/epimerase